MTVEPGFGGQAFMADVAKAKLLQAREYLSHKLHGGEVHVDGGVNRETAELVGGPRRGHPRRRLGALAEGPEHGPRDPAHPRARRRGLPVRPERRRAADPARQDGHVRDPPAAPGAHAARGGRGGRDPGPAVPIARGPGRDGRRDPALGPADPGVRRGGREGAFRQATRGARASQAAGGVASAAARA